MLELTCLKKISIVEFLQKEEDLNHNSDVE